MKGNVPLFWDTIADGCACGIYPQGSGTRPHAALKLYPAFLMRPTTQSPLCLNLDWPDTWPDQNVQRRQEILKSAEAESRIAFPGLPGLPARRATLVPIGAFYETHRKSGTPECAMLKSHQGRGQRL